MEGDRMVMVMSDIHGMAWHGQAEEAIHHPSPPSTSLSCLHTARTPAPFPWKEVPFPLPLTFPLTILFTLYLYYLFIYLFSLIYYLCLPSLLLLLLYCLVIGGGCWFLLSASQAGGSGGERVPHLPYLPNNTWKESALFLHMPACLHTHTPLCAGLYGLAKYAIS